MKRSELAYLQDTDNADMMSPDDMMDYTTEFDMMDRGEETEEQAAARKAEAGKLVGGLTSAIADITPFVGSAKAATELPEDVALVEELIAAGYEEGDIKKMGLGGTMAVLTGLGFIPGVKLAADVGKRAIKEGVEEAADELGTQTRRAFGQEALISPQRQAQLDAAAQLPASERRKFLKDVNRPDQLVFHGAESMSDSPEINVINEKIKKGLEYNVDDRVKNLNHPALNSYKPDMKSDEYAKKSQYAGLYIPIFDDKGEYATMPIRLRKTVDGELEIVQINEDTLADEQVLKTLDSELVEKIDSSNESARMIDSQLRSDLREISEELSAEPTGRSRKKQLLDEGFAPYEPDLEGRMFTGAQGMAGFTEGKHMEFRTDKALSTSVDPGVSMKPSFGGKDPENIVYARVRPEQVRTMTPEDYAAQTRFGSELARDLPLGPGQIGYRLPKSLHLEDEIAVTRPEELEVKSLTDDPYMVNPETSLLDLVKGQQKEVEKLLFDLDTINSELDGVPLYKITDLDETVDIKEAKAIRTAAHRQAYNKVREILTQAQGLGKYARGQGTGDTYDNLIDDIMLKRMSSYKSSGLYDTIEALAEHLPEGQRREHMRGLLMVAKMLKDKPSEDAATRSRQALRNLSDKTLRDVVYKNDVSNVTPEQARIIMSGDQLGYRDLKRLFMIGTENMNKGGLMTPR
jgi:hypothetical protein